jgi:hypothetical protein
VYAEAGTDSTTDATPEVCADAGNAMIGAELANTVTAKAERRFIPPPIS